MTHAEDELRARLRALRGGCDAASWSRALAAIDRELAGGAEVDRDRGPETSTPTATATGGAPGAEPIAGDAGGGEASGRSAAATEESWELDGARASSGDDGTRAAPPDGFRARVLLAQSGSTQRQQTCRSLEALGCEVDWAASAVEAVDLARVREYDVIFVDCDMPGLDGPRAVGAIRRRRRITGSRTTILAVSDEESVAARAGFLEAGADAAIGRPSTAEELVGLLERFA